MNTNDDLLEFTTPAEAVAVAISDHKGYNDTMHRATGARDGHPSYDWKFIELLQKAQTQLEAHADLVDAVRVCLEAEGERQNHLFPNSPASRYTQARINKLQRALVKAGEPLVDVEASQEEAVVAERPTFESMQNTIRELLDVKSKYASALISAAHALEKYTKFRPEFHVNAALSAIHKIGIKVAP